MKKILSLVLALLLVVTVMPLSILTASAATSGYYTYTISNSEVTITNVDLSISGKVTIPSTLGGYPVTSIGVRAFSNCTSLTSITIPDSVTSIGGSAFSYCTSLKSITISDSVTSIGSYAFYNCTSLKSVTIGNGVMSIGTYAFSRCYDLVRITIPDSVTSIGDYAFADCKYLKKIVIPDSVKFISSYAFVGCADFSIFASIDSYAESYAKSMGISFFDVNSVEVIIKDFVEAYGVPLYNKLDSFNGTPTKENIDHIIRLSLHFSDMEFFDVSYAKEEIEEVVNKHFIVDNLDLSLSSCYNAKIDTYIPNGSGFGGASVFEPTITQYENIYNVTIPYILAGEDEIAGYLFLGITKELKIVRFCVEHSYSSEYDSKCDDCGFIRTVTDTSYYTYTISNNKATITDVDTIISGDIAIPPTLGGYPVTNIGDFAFSYCKKLESVSIPDSVTSIGYGAFQWCTSLKSVTIGDSVRYIGKSAFKYCKSLTSVMIPDGVTSIYGYAFENCTSLTSITIPDSVTSIGSYAFYDTGYYNNSSNWENDVLYIGNHLIKAKTSLSGNYTLKNGTKMVSANAFENCKSLKGVTIPDSVTSIGDYAFRGCDSFTDVYYWGTKEDRMNIHFGYNNNLLNVTWYYIKGKSNTLYWNVDGTVLTISGKGVMANYSKDNPAPWGKKITEVIIEDGVKSIGNRAFYNCKSLSSITIPDSVAYIGNNAFSHCDSLKTIDLPDNLTTTGTYVFRYSGLKEITIPASLTTINTGMFDSCESLEKITLPATLKEVKEYAFLYNTSLTEVYFDSSERYQDVLTVADNNNKFKKATWHGNGITTGSTYNVYWALEDTKLTIYGEGSMASYPKNMGVDAPWGKDVTELVIEDGITHIGHRAFYGSTKLEKVTIGNTVKTIGNNAFNGCEKLTSVVIPDSVTKLDNTVFENCKALTEITLSKNIKKIGIYCFTGTSLKTVYYGGTAEDKENIVFDIGNTKIKRTANWIFG